MPKNFEEVLLKVQNEASKLRFKLTEKRQNILLILLKAHTPLSAYDIAAQYKDNYCKVIPAMSVYRILNSLIAANFVHKVKTTNQYLVCAHITCNHAHGIPQFLICDKCHLINEIGARNELIAELEVSLEKTGFSIFNQQLEFLGTCVNCKQNTLVSTA